MTFNYKIILKQIAFLVLCIQLVFTLSGFVSNVNSSNCCHAKKVVKNNHSCCEEMSEGITVACESQSSNTANPSLSNCGCIHSVNKDSLDYTVQNNFELQKETYFPVIYIFTSLQNINLSYHLKQRFEKEHSPPLFILDATLLI